MRIEGVPFCTTDWSRVPTTDHPGETGVAKWRTVEAGNVRVRMVEYSPGYLADHWCERGHVLLVLEGELVAELSSGESHVLRAGQSYQVAEGAAPHRSRTAGGAKLFIVD
jgi:hypothetical protein